MTFHPFRYLLLVLVFGFGCKQTSLEVTDISPKAVDGVLNLRMNHTAHDNLFTGQWSAPKLGRDKKFYRSPLTPNSGLVFRILKKETMILNVDLSKGVPSLVIQVNMKKFPVGRPRFRTTLAPGDVNVGSNQIAFLFSEPDKVEVKQIQIYPKRFQKFAHKIIAGSDFLTPVQFHYYCHPLAGSQLKLALIFKGQKPIKGKTTVESVKSKKETVRAIQSRKSFRISLLDESLHHICVEIPEFRSPYIRLAESQLIKPRKQASQQSQLPKIAKHTNILLILLDAARADHMSCYGYHRQTTPHIDRLSENGFRFNNVFVEAAYTLASTGTLLTGLPPDAHGVVSAFYSSLSEDITTLPELFQAKGYLTAALTSNPFFSSAYNYHQGFDHFIELFDGERVVNGNDFVAPFEELVSGLKDKPFFMYLHLREPHTPYSMPRPFFGKYQKKYKSPSEAYHTRINQIFSEESRTPAELQFMTDLYDENLSYADHIVGKLMEVLKKTKQFEETIIIITADHGEGLGEHELLGHNVILHREGIHVPLVLHFPGQEDGQKVLDNPAITSDLPVTLCDLVGLDYPYPEMSRGLSLFSLPTKRTRICRSTIMSSRYTGYVVDSFPYRAIIFPRLGDWNTQLFDVNEDPEAMRVLSSGCFQELALEFFLSRFIAKAAQGFSAGEKPKLGEKEKERLRALGYIK